MELNQAKLCIARTLNLSVGCQDESWCQSCSRTSFALSRNISELQMQPQWKRINFYKRAIIENRNYKYYHLCKQKKKKKNLQVREKMTF